MRYFKRIFCVALTGLSVVFVTCGKPRPADLVLHRGKVATVDESFSIQEAVAVRGDKIVFVGSNEEVQDFIYPNTTVIDCDEKLEELLWKKAIVNAAINPLSALLELSNGELLEYEFVKVLMTAIAREAMTVANGLEEGDTSIGRYIDVSITISGTTQDVFESALIMFYYRANDLDLTANGVQGDIGDINETTLCLYHFDEIHEEWVKVTTDLNWVIGMGVNTTDINVFGENYAGYIWIQTTELSLFAIAGQTIHIGFGLIDNVILIAILGTIGIVTVVFVRRWRRQRVRKMHTDIISSLQGFLGGI